MLKYRLMGSLAGLLFGALIGSGTGIVGGVFGAIAGAGLFMAIGAAWGFSAGPDLVRALQRFRNR